jgi:hypothetical protein
LINDQMAQDKFVLRSRQLGQVGLLRLDLLLILLCLFCVLAVQVGCTSLASPISGVPAHRLPSQFLAPPKNNLVPIDISRLRQEPPRQYLVDADDILGIYIEGVLGKSEEAPPVHMPDRFSDLPHRISNSNSGRRNVGASTRSAIDRARIDAHTS